MCRNTGLYIRSASNVRSWRQTTRIDFHQLKEKLGYYCSLWMLPKHETTHGGGCESCPFNCSQDMSAEDYLLLRSSALFPSKTCFCLSKAIIETKLLIILICGVFVYWSSAGARDDHTHFPLRKSHLRRVAECGWYWCPVLVRERMINTICNHKYQCNQRNSSKLLNSVRSSSQLGCESTFWMQKRIWETQRKK